MARTVTFSRPDGKTANGYLAEPAQGADAPAMVVIQEWWGLDDEIRGVADRLARSGYRALVPDLYRGKRALEANEAQHLMEGLDFADAAGNRDAAYRSRTGYGDSIFSSHYLCFLC